MNQLGESAQRAQDFLTQKGHRWTKPRQEVLNVFVEHHLPLTVSEVHQKISAFDIDLASIYRTIKLFHQNDILVTVDQVEEGQRYELSDRYGSHHHHLICRECGGVEDFEQCFVEKIKDEVSKKTDFLIKGHSLNFYGICVSCKQNT